MQRSSIPAKWSTLLSILPLVPGLWSLGGSAAGFSGPDPGKALVHAFGLYALQLLLLTLCITPLQRFTRYQWMPLRRTLGLYALGYAILHLAAYAFFFLGLDIGLLSRELVKRPYIIVGAIALVILCLLGFTSTRRWQRRMGRNWKRLHKMIYPATALAILHFGWQVKSGLGHAPWYALALAGLLVIRRLR